MPTYEYACEKCKKTFTIEKSIVDPPLTSCPLRYINALDEEESCGGKVKRLISGGSTFVLKGGGWGKDGY